jgi:two-component system, chemotaxis family, chemotaxis protein CheY
MSRAYKMLRVLIVDADKFSRDLIKDVLESLGFEGEKIFRTGNGAEALENLRTNKMDIVICSRNMGPIDGVTFVRTLRDPKESPAPGVPVVFCSRQLDRQLVDEIRRTGVNEVIVKPVTISAIESRVRALLEKPRPLLKVSDYVGPDRRRVDEGNVPRERRAQNRDISRGPHKTVDI